MHFLLESRFSKNPEKANKTFPPVMPNQVLPPQVMSDHPQAFQQESCWAALDRAPATPDVPFCVLGCSLPLARLD